MRIIHRSPFLAGPAADVRRPGGRTAFTLVELIVAMTIIAVLVGLAVLIIPQLQDSQRVAKGGDVVQGQLFVAKQMALRDQTPRGVRLILAPGTQLATSLQLIEQPAPYTVGAVQSVSTTADPVTGWFQVVIGQDPITNALPNISNGTVQPGDFLDLNPVDTYCTPTGSMTMHVIMQAVQGSPTPAQATVWVLSQPNINTNIPPPPGGYGYRIVRSPRPLIGTPAVSLPDNVVVDLTNTPNASSIIPLDNNNFDVLFDPSGKVLRAAGNQGKVILWVKDPTAPANSGDQTLIAVSTRNGAITAQPVNVSGPDPYSFVKDGVTSGM